MVNNKMCISTYMGADQESIYIKKICSLPKLDDSSMQKYSQGAL